mgnify:FL=1
MIVSMVNESGVTRQVKFGFSWTSFFFGGIPFFFIGMPSQGVMWVIISVVTFGLSNLYLMFRINKQTALHYLDKGYKATGDGWNIAGPAWGVSSE